MKFILGLQFLVVSGGGDDGEPELPLETVSVFLRKKQISSLIVAFKPDDICPVKGYESFGTSCNGRYVIGVEQNVYEFKLIENNSPIWSKLPPTKVDRSGSKCCLITENKIFVTGGYGQGLFSSEILSVECCDPSQYVPLSKNSRCVSIHTGSYTNSKAHWKICSTNPPVNVRYHTMTYLGKGKVMLIGGMNLKRGDDVYSKNVFLGEITNDQEDVKWRTLDSLIKCRYGHIAFKLGNDVITAGGCNRFEKHKSCEIYNLRHGEWKLSKHSLPIGLSNASVVVDSQERFAVITGGETDNYKTSNRIFLYTKINGFIEYQHCKLSTGRKGHISLIVR